MADIEDPVDVRAPSNEDAQWLIDELEALVHEAANDHDLDPMVISAALKEFSEEFELQMLLNHSLVHHPAPFQRTRIVEEDDDCHQRPPPWSSQGVPADADREEDDDA